MALTSPGVEVTVIDESFYTPAEPGTTPLIVVATAQDKTNAAGTGVASATSAANAGNAFKVTSQKELVDLFGVPNFEKTASNTPIHGSELNEYGLLAAYSLLGVSNAAFIVRADADLGELQGQTEAPGANPADGTWWINTDSTTWGIQEWNSAAISTTGGQKFANKTPIVLTDTDTTKVDSTSGGKPKASVGSIGQYAFVFETVDGTGSFSAGRETARLYYKSPGLTVAGVAAGAWVLVGSQDWALSHATVQGATFVGGAGSFTINGTTVTVGGSDAVDDVVTTINGLLAVSPAEADTRGIYAANVSGKIYLYSNAANDSVGDSTLSNSITIAAGSGTLSNYGFTAATYYGPALAQAPHTSVPQWKAGDSTPRPTGSVWIKTTEPNFGARWRAAKWSSATTSWVSYEAPIYASGQAALYYLDRANGGTGIATDILFVQSNSNENAGYDSTPATATFRVWRRAATGTTAITSAVVTSSTFTAATNTVEIAESIKGQLALSTAVSISFVATGATTDADLLAGAINASALTNVSASVDTQNRVVIEHALGGEIRFTDGTSTPIAAAFTPYNINTLAGTANFYTAPVGADDDFIASNWQPLAASNFYASPDDPQAEPTDGQLWYNPEFSDVDIMVHDGTTWVGYRNASSPYNEVASTRVGYLPIVSATNPWISGVTADGDIWISTADLESYPIVYKYDDNLSGTPASERWVRIDTTDQTTEDGILFADARWSTSGGTAGSAYPAGDLYDLAVSNYLDPDTPDPALYPQGMLLWNLRRSGGNVKRYANNYIDITADNTRQTGDPAMSGYYTDRWVTQSGNQEDGSGSFGRKAQRKVIIEAMKSAIDTSDQIRDEERRNFNMIAAPGYPELMSNLVNLNIDRGLTAFVIGDTPLRLAADATTLTNWGSNANLVTDNGDDGLVTYDEYLGTFYPNGFTTDLGGSNAVVPASHMMMRTIALSDQVSFPWFAPAGTRRGGISNATAVGFIDAATGEFQTVALNEGQRDTLYDLKINPITFFNGVGLVNYGQKTRARNASALDRINVARLVVYLRSQLNKLARPYIFEPNDKITRDEIKQSVESLLLELVGLRALYDFAVVCDETNNTPARVDRNELYVDIAIEPVKAIEFIYIPLRVKNTGEI
jgi:hypothetical protein